MSFHRFGHTCFPGRPTILVTFQWKRPLNGQMNGEHVDTSRPRRARNLNISNRRPAEWNWWPPAGGRPVQQRKRRPSSGKNDLIFSLFPGSNGLGRDNRWVYLAMARFNGLCRRPVANRFIAIKVVRSHFLAKLSTSTCRSSAMLGLKGGLSIKSEPKDWQVLTRPSWRPAAVDWRWSPGRGSGSFDAQPVT